MLPEFSKRRSEFAESDFPTNASISLLCYVLHSYWIVQEFNRRIGGSADEDLLDICETSLRKILRLTDGELTFPCPSGVYAEVAVISADDKLAILEKSGRLSVSARLGMKWTCGIEEGLVWHKDIHDDHIDFKNAVERGLDRELGVSSSSISSIELLGIAIEYPYLNTALVGCARLTVDADELVDRVAESEDFGLNCQFVPQDEAFARIFADPASDGSDWHPTARLRVLLSLYRARSREEVWRRLEPRAEVAPGTN